MAFKIRSSLLEVKTNSYGKDSGKKMAGSGVIKTDCSLGTNPFGHSSKVNEAGTQIPQINLSNYPQNYQDLKEAIIQRWEKIASLKTEKIVFGGGAIDVIAKTNRIFIEPDSMVLGSAPQFPDYANDVRCMGGGYHAIPFDQNDAYAFSPEPILQAMNHKYVLVHLDNPNNPTGQRIPLESIREITSKAAEMNVCVVVDEAYGDFIDDKESAIGLMDDYDNLMVIRSFSKGLGLAGLRIGYMIASETICQYYEMVGAPFTINAVGHQLGKIVLKDQAFIESSKQKIRALKNSVKETCLRLNVLKSDDRVPIMVLEHPDKNCDLFQLFLSHGVLTVSGNSFESLGQRHVRIRIPKDTTHLQESIQRIEATL